MPTQPLTTIELIRHVPAVRPPVTAVLQGHTLVIAVAGEFRLGAGSGDLGHCGEQGGPSERQVGRWWTMSGGHRHCRAGTGFWGSVSGPMVSGSARAQSTHGGRITAHVGCRLCGSGLTHSPVRAPHAAGTPRHATTGAHVGRPQPGLARMERKGRRGGRCAVPGRHALTLPCPPSISFSSAPAWPGSGFTCSPGVTAAATAAGGGGGVCAGKEGVISSRPAWELGACRAEPAPSYPP